jgi:hypothetical protein
MNLIWLFFSIMLIAQSNISFGVKDKIFGWTGLIFSAVFFSNFLIELNRYG